MKIIVFCLLLLASAGCWVVSESTEKKVQSDGTPYPEAAPREPDENISGELDPAPEENFIEN